MTTAPIVQPWLFQDPLLTFLSYQGSSVVAVIHRTQVCAWGSEGSLGGEWFPQCNVSILWGVCALPFCLLSADSIVQPLEESNKSWIPLRVVVGQSDCIFNLVVQAPHKSGTFCRGNPLNISSTALKFYIIRGEVKVYLFECLQYWFGCCHAISVLTYYFLD
jgi:hypothetical protein